MIFLLCICVCICLYTCYSFLLVIGKDDFERYCDEIENTPRWGGQLEVNNSDISLCKVMFLKVKMILIFQSLMIINQ